MELELPEQWAILPVVNESYLVPYRDGAERYPERVPPPPEPEDVDGEEHFSVEAFRDHKFVRGRLHYRVKWTGYPETSNTWQNVEQLSCVRICRLMC